MGVLLQQCLLMVFLYAMLGVPYLEGLNLPFWIHLVFENVSERNVCRNY